MKPKRIRLVGGDWTVIRTADLSRLYMEIDRLREFERLALIERERRRPVARLVRTDAADKTPTVAIDVLA